VSKPLPIGWAMALLGDISLEVRNGISTKPSEEGGLPILRISAVRPMSLNLSDVRYLPSDSLGAGTYHLKPDDLLFTRYNGNRDLVGACARVPRITGEVVYPDKLIRVRIATSVALPSYVERAVNASDARRYLDQKLKTSAGQIGVSGADLKALPLPLPPLPEQHRIADKLDTVLARVDAVNARLARVAPLLKRFRQSVLAAATSGRLTADWRAAQAHDLSGWAHMPLADLVLSIDQGWSPKCESTHAAPNAWGVIKTTAIQPLVFHAEENKALPSELQPKVNLSLCAGDVLITRAGPRARAGITCLVEQNYPGLMLCDKAYRVRVDAQKLLPAMLNLVLNSPDQLEVLDQMKTGISESGVNLTQAKFKELPISLPALSEQTEIVRRVELLFGFADRLEARLQAAQTASSRLTPSLLAKAFRGELVPQDPNDEPASELLKRLAQSQPVGDAKKGRGAARSPKAQA